MECVTENTVDSEEDDSASTTVKTEAIKKALLDVGVIKHIKCGKTDEEES